MQKNRPRILIADDHTLVADLCRKLFESEFEVVGIVNDGHAMVRAAIELKPDVILVDISMPGLNGLDAGHKVKEVLPAVKLVFLTMDSSTALAAEAFRRGASGYLLKTSSSSEMVTAMREVLRGNTYLAKALCKDEVNFLCRSETHLAEKDNLLTERQREVLQLLAEGKVMKEIGAILNMTTRTVAFHKYRMMETLGARSNAELVRYAVRSHIVSA